MCLSLNFQQVFSIITLVLFLGMIGYFLVAKYVFYWSSHGDAAPEEPADPEPPSTDGNNAPKE